MTLPAEARVGGTRRKTGGSPVRRSQIDDRLKQNPAYSPPAVPRLTPLAAQDLRVYRRRGAFPSQDRQDVARRELRHLRARVDAPAGDVWHHDAVRLADQRVVDGKWLRLGHVQR